MRIIILSVIGLFCLSLMIDYSVAFATDDIHSNASSANIQNTPIDRRDYQAVKQTNYPVHAGGTVYHDIQHDLQPVYEPNSFLDPLHTPPGQPLPVELTIFNVTDAPLDLGVIDVNYMDGSDWIGFGVPSQDPIPSGESATLIVTFNYNGSLTLDPSGWDAWIRVNHNGPTGTDSLPVHLTVASDFDLPQHDTLRTTNKKLAVYNTGRLSGGSDGASLNIPGDCDSGLTAPNADLYLYDASPMIAWNNGSENIVYTSLYSQQFTEDGTFRPQSDLIMESFPADGYNKMTCTLSTSDSLFGVGIRAWAPTDSNDFVILQYDFTVWKPGVKGMDQVYIGMFLDWDIPSDDDARNGSGYDDFTFTVWQRGSQSSMDDEYLGCPIMEGERFGGVSCWINDMANAWTADNEPFLAGSGLNPDSIYNRMSTTVGSDIYNGAGEDTVVDLHTGITFAEVDMSVKAKYRIWVVLVTTNDGPVDLEEQVYEAWGWAGSIIPCVCRCIPGDANGDEEFSVSDVVYIINYIFKGGPKPTPYSVCSGDPNASCHVSVADAVYLINYIFKGGPDPATCIQWRDGDYDFGPCGPELYK